MQALYSRDNTALDTVAEGEEALLVLDMSPFYGESGGQIGDHGFLRSDNATFEVLDTQKQNDVMIHRGKVTQGSVKVGDQLDAEVDAIDRAAITLNHSATHLLHAALRKVLGEHVAQKGSLVAADRLRFDFSHTAPVSGEELQQIEAIVNQEILQNSDVTKEVMPIAAAKEKGAIALFGEKYGEQVRVVTMGGDYSVEFCGGCHVNRTGDIGLLKITSETGISAGVRRIEAVTGKGALALIAREEQTLKKLGDIVKSGADDLVEKVQQLANSNKALEKELQQLKGKLAASAGDDLSAQAVDMAGAKVLISQVDGFNAKSLRDTVDQLKNKLGSSIIVLATTDEGKVSLVAGVSKDLTERVKAGELVNMVAQQVGGKGGGRPDMAMAGGSDVAAVPDALASVKPWLEAKL